MSETILTRLLFLPELKVVSRFVRNHVSYFNVVKTSNYEVCPKCATISKRVYDTRVCKIKDSPIRDLKVALLVRKRRFKCSQCKSIFTEPIPGVKKYRRTTERFRQSVFKACEDFVDLKRVRAKFNCSYRFIYKVLYERLELERRKRQYPWPHTIGIDEHSFRRNKYGRSDYVTVITDLKGRRLKEVVDGKNILDLHDGLEYIPGRDNVKNVVLDMSRPYKNFAQSFFPNAELIADKFHVVRLFNPIINKMRKEITGDKRSNPIRKLILANNHKLEYFKRNAIYRWLKHYPELEEIYYYKQQLHKLYRIRGYKKARKALIKLLDKMALSINPNVQRIRTSLYSWRNEILNYFKTKLTNARTEGFNNKAKLVKRRAYGYKSFKNYRLRLLNACR